MEPNQEKLKILVGVNTLTSIDTEVYGAHSNFWYYVGKMYPNATFYKLHPRRLSIDHMRNMAAQIALSNQCDYLMFIDDDIIIEKDVLDVLLAANKDVVAELTYIRGYPFKPMIFKDILNKDGIKVLDNYHDFEKDTVDGLVECSAVGFSCVLIKCSLLSKLEPPYFVTGLRNTEDIYFCMKARRDLGEDVSIFCDTTRPTIHLLDKVGVTKSNVEALRKLYEELGYKPEGTGDFPLETVESALAQLELTLPIPSLEEVNA